MKKHDDPTIDTFFAWPFSSPPFFFREGNFTKVIKAWNFNAPVSFDHNTALTTTVPGWNITTTNVTLQTLLGQQYLTFEGEISYIKGILLGRTLGDGAYATWDDSPLTITIECGGYEMKKEIKVKFVYPDIPGEMA